MARNEKFQQLVKDVAFAALARRQKNGPAGYVKVRIHERQMSEALDLLCFLHSVLILCVAPQNFLSNEDLNKLSLDEGVSLADQVALTIGQYVNAFTFIYNTPTLKNNPFNSHQCPNTQCAVW